MAVFGAAPAQQGFDAGDQAAAQIDLGLIVQGQLVAFQGELWLIGGRNALGSTFASVSIFDPASEMWRAGPGLWVKTVEDGGRRLFEVTHAVAGRSAESAGLKVGDRLDAIGGKPSEKMDFAEAVDRLYGAPGSDVEVSVLRGKSQSHKLKRGLRWAAGKSTPLPPAYNAQ